MVDLKVWLKAQATPGPGPEWKDPRGLDTPFRVIATCCGAACLTKAEYLAQLAKANVLWGCPIHQNAGRFDDDWYEARADSDD